MRSKRKITMQVFEFHDASKSAAWQVGAGPRPELAGRLIAVWEGARSVTDWSQCIVAIAQQRDRQQFAALFAHFGPRLKGFFLRLGVTQGVAEDLMQETMLVVWRKADRFDPERAGASTWIFTVARNLRIDLKRRERDPGKLAEFYDGADEPTPSDHLLTAERDGRIHQALTSLPADQAQVIRLSFFEDRPHSQIAEDLKIPLGTVKSRVRLAMMRLRALVEERQ
ncbi:MAG: sigma-70 family RNA polymerase sigma factor [Rhizomicrobium sp.]